MGENNNAKILDERTMQDLESLFGSETSDVPAQDNNGAVKVLELSDEDLVRISDVRRASVVLRYEVIGLEYRSSALGKCTKAVAYEAFGYQKTDEIPPEVVATMNKGTLLESVGKYIMGRYGWIVEDDVSPVAINIGGGMILTGNPDGYASHPVYTNGKKLVVEIKTRSESAMRFAEAVGVEVSHRDAAWQASLYAMAQTGVPQDVVVATFSSETWDYSINVIPAERVKVLYEEAVERARLIRGVLSARKLPEPELPKGHFKCGSCEFRTACGNNVKDPVIVGGTLSDNQLVDEIIKWDKASQSIPSTSSPESKVKKDAAAVIKEHVTNSGIDEFDIPIDGRIFNLKLNRNPDYSVDFEKLNELVSPEVREQIVLQGEKTSFGIRDVTKKRQQEAERERKADERERKAAEKAEKADKGAAEKTAKASAEVDALKAAATETPAPATETEATAELPL